MTHGPAAARGAARLCGMLLLLYPRAFRDEFGDEMTCDFEDATVNAWAKGGALKVLAIWTQYGGDLGWNLVIQWIRTGWPTLIGVSVSWTALLVGLLALQSVSQADPVAMQLHVAWLILVAAMALVSAALGRYHGKHGP